MGVASSAVGREAGRGLLTLANLITAVAPVAADWNGPQRSSGGARCETRARETARWS